MCMASLMRLIKVEREDISHTGWKDLGGELGEVGGEEEPGARSFLVDQYQPAAQPPTQIQPIFVLPCLPLSSTRWCQVLLPAISDNDDCV